MFLKDIENPSPVDKLMGLKPQSLSDSQREQVFSLRITCYNNLAGLYIIYRG